MHTLCVCVCVCVHRGSAQTLPSLSFCSSGFPLAKSTHNALLSCQRIQAPWNNFLSHCPFIWSLILSLLAQKISLVFLSTSFYSQTVFWDFSIGIKLVVFFWRERGHRSFVFGPLCIFYTIYSTTLNVKYSEKAGSKREYIQNLYQLLRINHHKTFITQPSYAGSL